MLLPESDSSDCLVVVYRLKKRGLNFHRFDLHLNYNVIISHVMFLVGMLFGLLYVFKFHFSSTLTSLTIACTTISSTIS